MKVNAISRVSQSVVTRVMWRAGLKTQCATYSHQHHSSGIIPISPRFRSACTSREVAGGESSSARTHAGTETETRARRGRGGPAEAGTDPGSGRGGAGLPPRGTSTSLGSFWSSAFSFLMFSSQGL